jgi:hypothetical protein
MSNIQDVVLYDNYNGYHFLFFVIPCLVPFSEPKNKNKNSKVCFWFLFCRLIPLAVWRRKKASFSNNIERERKSSRWWPSDKSLRSRDLLPLWSQVRALWLLIWWPLEAYMVANFRARGISRGARKLAWTPTLN